MYSLEFPTHAALTPKHLGETASGGGKEGDGAFCADERFVARLLCMFTNLEDTQGNLDPSASVET